MKLGFKLFTTNENLFIKAKEIIEAKKADFIELYIVPNHQPKNIEILKNIPLILHAPNYNHKFNLGVDNKIFRDSIQTIKKIIEDVNTNKAIFHPGVKDKDFSEQVLESNIKKIKEEKIDIIMENIPCISFDKKYELPYASLEQFKKLVNKFNLKVCIDIAHTFASANYLNIDKFTNLNDFLKLKPFMIHICDGDFNSDIDKHLSFNKGDFPLAKIKEAIPNNSLITVETPKRNGLSEDLINLNYFKKLK